MKNRELAEKLLENPDNEVWCGAWNGYVDTYALVDYVLNLKYSQVSNDFFGTPGRMDGRILQTKSENITYIGSRFGKVPDQEIDTGDNNIDYPIKTLNGPGGDPDLVWKLNKFTKVGEEWIKQNITDGWEMKYNPDSEIFECLNTRDQKRFTGIVKGIETLRNVIEVCGIKTEIWT